MVKDLKITISVFVLVIAIILIFAGANLNKSMQYAPQVNESILYQRKDEIVLEQEKLVLLMNQLNKSIQENEDREKVLLTKLSSITSNQDYLEEAALIAQQNKITSKDAPIPTKPVATAPKPKPKPTPVTSAS